MDKKKEVKVINRELIEGNREPGKEEGAPEAKKEGKAAGPDLKSLKIDDFMKAVAGGDKEGQK